MGDQPPGANVAFDRIFLTNTDGTGQEPVTAKSPSVFDEHPAWAPDGTRIAYHSGPGTFPGYSIWVVNADGSGKVKITEDPVNGLWPSWSPDGTQIAFTDINQREDNCQIFLVAPDGTGLTQLTDGPRDLFPAWAPDGTVFFIRRQGPLCFDPSGDVFAVGTDGTGLRQITTFGYVGGFGISPDGKTIAYHDTKSRQIVVYPLDGKQPPLPVFDVDFRTYFIQPSWSPDGRTIAIAASDWGIPFGSKLYLVNADGSASHEVPIDNGVWDPVWRPQ